MKMTLRLKAYIQPFERTLALMEVSSLAGSQAIPIEHDAEGPVTFEVRSRIPAAQLAERLAYWETVTATDPLYTQQVLLEATTNVVRNGTPLDEIAERLPFRESPALPNRRCLRYGMHGLHEYRGKFFPQLVRSLVNVSGTPIGGIVMDPMCGSGTTVVEAVTGGYVGLGADINPLSVFMARTKAALIRTPSSALVAAYESVRSTLLSGRSSDNTALDYLEHLPKRDQEYLASWFPEQVLFDLDRIAIIIQNQPDGSVRDLLWLSLSNILRKVSWQKTDDLRVRREIRLDEDVDPVREFLEELGRSVRGVLAFKYQYSARSTGDFEVVEADARHLDREWQQYAEKVDVVITSPPYATALPYLDTDRLSLSYLGLLSRREYRQRDQEMIGNREVGDGLRRYYWERFNAEKYLLPEGVSHLIEQIDQLNSRVKVGFRRRNLPALLAKYFFDMQVVLQNLRVLLKPGGHAFIVVGDNSTTAGGQKVSIETSRLLADLAVSSGLEHVNTIPMEMLPSRDIFRKNSMTSEVILDFVAPG